MSPNLGRFLRACVALGLEVTEDESYHSICGHSCEFSVYKVGEPLLSLVDVKTTPNGVTEASFIISLAAASGLGLATDD